MLPSFADDIRKQWVTESGVWRTRSKHHRPSLHPVEINSWAGTNAIADHVGVRPGARGGIDHDRRWLDVPGRLGVAQLASVSNLRTRDLTGVNLKQRAAAICVCKKPVNCKLDEHGRGSRRHCDGKRLPGRLGRGRYVRDR